MTLTEHLYELRARLAKALAAVAVTTIVAYILFDPIFEVIRAPYCDLPPHVRNQPPGDENCRLYAFNVLDQFLLRLRLSFIVGAVLAAPVWLYQLWAFVAPGLHRRERRWTLLFTAVASVLFGVGCFFAWITLKVGLNFLLQVAGSGVVTLPNVKGYLGYVVAMLLVFGVSFLFPLIVVMLNFAGVLPAARLRAWWRAVVFGVFVFAAFVTPSQDPFTMSAMALPLSVFYAGAVVVASLHDRRSKRRREAESFDGLSDDEASPLDAEPSPLDAEPSPLDVDTTGSDADADLLR